MMKVDYHESMRSSAEQLNQLRNLGLGFSWKDVGRPIPTRLPEEMMACLSSPSREKPSSPIALSSSSSDTEDDVPLSSRVKRPKVQLHNDISVRRSESPVRVEKERAAAESTSGAGKQPVQQEVASSGKIAQAAPPKAAKPDDSQPESTKVPENAKGEAETGAQDREKAQETTPAAKADTAKTKKSKDTSKSAKRARPAGRKSKLKETVIDLEAEQEPEFQFTTAPKPKPRKTVGLKQLKNENPALYQAALKRYASYVARDPAHSSSTIHLFEQ